MKIIILFLSFFMSYQIVSAKNSFFVKDLGFRSVSDRYEIHKICIDGYVYYNHLYTYSGRGNGGLVQAFQYNTKKGVIPIKCSK